MAIQYSCNKLIGYKFSASTTASSMGWVMIIIFRKVTVCKMSLFTSVGHVLMRSSVVRVRERISRTQVLQHKNYVKHLRKTRQISGLKL